MVNKNYGVDNETHHLIQLKVPPSSLVALRNELCKMENKDIYDYAIAGRDFEESLGRIAEKLDILLDGAYDAAELCDVLVTAMRGRGTNKTQPHLRDSRLQNVELVETENEVTVTSLEENEVTLAPSEVTETPEPKLLLPEC